MVFLAFAFGFGCFSFLFFVFVFHFCFSFFVFHFCFCFSFLFLFSAMLRAPSSFNKWGYFSFLEFLRFLFRVFGGLWMCGVFGVVVDLTFTFVTFVVVF